MTGGGGDQTSHPAQGRSSSEQSFLQEAPAQRESLTLDHCTNVGEIHKAHQD